MSFKNLKPSQLPVHTAIDVPKYGEYLKVQDGIWEEVYSGCCSHIGRLSDDGRKSDYGDKYGMNYTVKADDIFTDFTVISVPPGYIFSSELLHGGWPDLDVDTYKDGTSLHFCKGFNCEQ